MGEGGDVMICAVVLLQAAVKAVGGADVETATWVFEDVDEKFFIRLFQPRQVGLEPTTSRLTADCSTIELLSNFSTGIAPVGQSR